MARHTPHRKRPQQEGPRLDANAALARYLQDKQVSSFEEAFAKCRPYLVKAFRNFGVPTQDLEDTIQETWLEAIASPTQPTGDPLSWLARVGINSHIDQLRRLTVRQFAASMPRPTAHTPLLLDIQDVVHRTIGCMTPAQQEAWNQWGRAQTLSGHPTPPFGHPVSATYCATALGISSNAFACRLKGGLESITKQGLRASA